MCAVLLIGALAILFVDGWATYCAVAPTGSMKSFRITYLIAIAGCAVIAIFTTFFVEYRPDKNTRIFGWPVPVVVFQRESTDAPWLDFVGPTVIFGYPMNLLIFAVAPSLAVLLGAYLRATPTDSRGTTPVDSED